MTDYGNWIFEENLQKTLKGLAFICNYNFDESDLLAISQGIKESANTSKTWFEYPLAGEFQIGLSLTQEQGTSVYEIHITSEKDILKQVELLMYFAQTANFTGD